jgi:hypothetical protein
VLMLLADNLCNHSSTAALLKHTDFPNLMHGMGRSLTSPVLVCCLHNSYTCLLLTFNQVATSSTVKISITTSPLIPLIPSTLSFGGDGFPPTDTSDTVFRENQAN